VGILTLWSVFVLPSKLDSTNSLIVRSNASTRSALSVGSVGTSRLAKDIEFSNTIAVVAVGPHDPFAIQALFQMPSLASVGKYASCLHQR